MFSRPPPPTPAPPPPAVDIAPPTTARKARLATQGRQSTFLGSLTQSSLAAPAPTLTGLNT